METNSPRLTKLLLKPQLHKSIIIINQIRVLIKLTFLQSFRYPPSSRPEGHRGRPRNCANPRRRNLVHRHWEHTQRPRRLHRAPQRRPAPPSGTCQTETPSRSQRRSPRRGSEPSSLISPAVITWPPEAEFPWAPSCRRRHRWEGVVTWMGRFGRRRISLLRLGNSVVWGWVFWSVWWNGGGGGWGTGSRERNGEE